MTTDALKAIARGVAGMLQTGSDELVDQLFAPDYLSCTQPWLGADRTRSGVKSDLAAFHDAFPDAVFVVEDVIARDDKIYLRWTMTGTHRGRLLGIDPSGRRVTHSGQELFTVTDGRIVARHGQEDRLELERKLRRRALPGPADHEEA